VLAQPTGAIWENPWYVADSQLTPPIDININVVQHLKFHYLKLSAAQPLPVSEHSSELCYGLRYCTTIWVSRTINASDVCTSPIKLLSLQTPSASTGMTAHCSGSKWTQQWEVKHTLPTNRYSDTSNISHLLVHYNISRHASPSRRTNFKEDWRSLPRTKLPWKSQSPCQAGHPTKKWIPTPTTTSALQKCLLAYGSQRRSDTHLQRSRQR